MGELKTDPRWKSEDLVVTHRLDQPVTGVILFARTAEALERFNRLLRERRVEKIYWALVTADPGEAGELRHFLLKNGRTNRTRVCGEDTAGAREARLTYRPIVKTQRYWGVEVSLITGRHHQIRAQLAAEGWPIKGDIKYGARRSNPGGGIGLHARSLSFVHPFTGKPTKIIAPPPTKPDGSPDPLWELFPSRDAAAGTSSDSLT